MRKCGFEDGGFIGTTFYWHVATELIRHENEFDNTEKHYKVYSLNTSY